MKKLLDEKPKADPTFDKDKVTSSHRVRAPPPLEHIPYQCKFYGDENYKCTVQPPVVDTLVLGTFHNVSDVPKEAS